MLEAREEVGVLESREAREEREGTGMLEAMVEDREEVGMLEAREEVGIVGAWEVADMEAREEVGIMGAWEVADMLWVEVGRGWRLGGGIRGSYIEFTCTNLILDDSKYWFGLSMVGSPLLLKISLSTLTYSLGFSIPVLSL